MSRFPNVLAAAERRQRHLDDVNGKDLWALGEALIKDCGKPGDDRTHNGSHGRIEAAAKELAAKGFDYNLNTLVNIRETAFAFPSVRRITDVAFWTHSAAGSPDLLDAATKLARREGVSVTAAFVSKAARRWREQDDEKRKADHAKAKEDLEKAKDQLATARERKRSADTDAQHDKADEAHAKAEEAVEAAKERVEETRTAPPRRKRTAPKDEEPTVAIELEVSRLANDAALAAKEAHKRIRGKVHLMSPKAIAALTEKAVKAANLWNEINSELRQTSREKRGLAVVGE